MHEPMSTNKNNTVFFSFLESWAPLSDDEQLHSQLLTMYTIIQDPILHDYELNNQMQYSKAIASEG